MAKDVMTKDAVLEAIREKSETDIKRLLVNEAFVAGMRALLQIGKDPEVEDPRSLLVASILISHIDQKKYEEKLESESAEITRLQDYINEEIKTRDDAIGALKKEYEQLLKTAIATFAADLAKHLESMESERVRAEAALQLEKDRAANELKAVKGAYTREMEVVNARIEQNATESEQRERLAHDRGKLEWKVESAIKDNDVKFLNESYNGPLSQGPTSNLSLVLGGVCGAFKDSIKIEELISETHVHHHQGNTLREDYLGALVTRIDSFDILARFINGFGNGMELGGVPGLKDKFIQQCTNEVLPGKKISNEKVVEYAKAAMAIGISSEKVQNLAYRYENLGREYSWAASFARAATLGGAYQSTAAASHNPWTKMKGDEDLELEGDGRESDEDGQEESRDEVVELGDGRSASPSTDATSGGLGITAARGSSSFLQMVERK